MSVVAGVLAVLGYVVVIVGVNLPNPLVPLYTADYGLSPLAQSVLFSLYLLALVATLLLVLRAGDRVQAVRPGRMLVVALILCALSDLLMTLGATAFAGLVAGRLVAGVSVGLATGSAATLALSALGERARTVVASGAVIGSLVGNLGGGLLGTLLATPQRTAFIVHLLVTLVVAVGLWLTSPSVQVQRRQDEPEPVGFYEARHRHAALVLGAMSWSVAGVVLALVPADLRATRPDISLFEAVVPGGVFLATAWAAQVAGRRHLLRLRAWQLSFPLVVGMGLIALALERGQLGLLVVGAVICGLGQGPAYSLGLATVTHGLRAARQGRAASAYAAVAYGTCGAATTATGAFALSTGVPTAMATLTAGLAVAGLVAAAFAGAPQRAHLALG